MTLLTEIPDLSVRMSISSNTKWDLRTFLCLGLSSARKQSADKYVQAGDPGRTFRPNRLSLVLRLRDALDDAYAVSFSKRTIVSSYGVLRDFYRFCDSVDIDPTVATAVDTFHHWHEATRARRSARLDYSNSRRLAVLLATASDTPIERFTSPLKLRKPRRNSDIGRRADTEVLTDTFTYGSVLGLLTKKLSTATITGSLPIPFVVNERKTELWGGIPSDASLRSRHISKYGTEKAWIRDPHRIKVLRSGTIDHRRVLVNLRIEAELLIFIAQTGMNLAQAFNLQRGSFRYRSRDDGYLVKNVYKARAGIELEFQIFKHYRAHLERYLTWRDSIALDDSRLFPFLARPCDPARSEHHFNGVRKLFQQLNMRFIGPRELRGTRINYFLRRTDDPTLTAAIAGHSVETLIGVYQRPHHQRALSEIQSYWEAVGGAHLSAGPGTCNMNPSGIAPSTGAPEPDCRTASGCLFCADHRDVFSLDYAWSLVSLRYLRGIELDTYLPMAKKPHSTPAGTVIHAISEKLESMRSFNDQGFSWVKEATERVEEGDYHPRWQAIIVAAESFR